MCKSIMLNLLVVVASFLVRAQSVNSRNYSMGGSVGINYWLNNEKISDYEVIKNGANNFNGPAFNLSFDIGYSLNQTIWLETGLGFARNSFSAEISWKNIAFGDELNPATGLIYETQMIPGEIESRFDLYALSVPTRLRFISAGKSLRFTSSVAVQHGIIIAQSYMGKVTVNGSLDEGTVKSEYDYNPYSATLAVGAGVKVQPGSRLYLQMEPQFRYQLTSMNKSASSEHPLGIAMIVSGGIIF